MQTPETGTDAKEASVEAPVDAGHDADTGAALHDGGDGAAQDASDGGDTGVMDAADASDASDANLKTIPPGLLAYPTQYATALCAGFANCCAADASTFDMASCISAWNVGGWDNTLPNNLVVYDAGNLTFNEDAGNGCVATLQNWPCNTYGPTESQGIIGPCLNVLGGTIPVNGTGCQSSFECVTGSYCNTTGTCIALVGDGGTCQRDEQCSQAGTNVPALFCDVFSGDGGSGTCAPRQSSDAGAACGNANAIDDLACSAEICGDDNICGDPATNPASLSCSAYPPP